MTKLQQKALNEVKSLVRLAWTKADLAMQLAHGPALAAVEGEDVVRLREATSEVADILASATEWTVALDQEPKEQR